ncbi:MAG: hypothetical protein LC114_04560, partial [Bryobacterales bacterium]|nr:hypothetical protein [Bryobacterales bacterium]
QYMGFSVFAAQFFAEHSPRIPEDFAVTDAIVDDFRNFLNSEKIEVTNEEFAANRDWVREELKRALLTYSLGDEKAESLMVRDDSLVTKAMDAMGRAQSLQETALRMQAQRAGLTAEQK